MSLVAVFFFFFRKETVLNAVSRSTERRTPLAGLAKGVRLNARSHLQNGD